MLYKNTNHQQMHKREFYHQLSHTPTCFDPAGSSSGRTFVVVTLRLRFIVELECAVDCVLRCFRRRELSAVRACRQYTAHSHSAIKCNLSVTITKVLPEDDPAGSKHVGVCYVAQHLTTPVNNRFCILITGSVAYVCCR
jgi:hypothetical protein